MSQAKQHRVALFARYPLEAAAGNATAVRALMGGLRGRGWAAAFVGPGQSSQGDAPDLCHAFHGGEPASAARRAAAAIGAPLVITLTGTDMERWDAEVESNIRAADAVVALVDHQLAALVERGAAERAVLIPQGQDQQAIGEARKAADFEWLRGLFGHGAPRSIALLLAGLRPVKNVGLALDAMDQLRAHRAAACEIGLLVAGDVLDTSYARDLTRRAAEHGDVRIAPALDHAAALRALASATVVLNTSESEGASRAILEAQAVGAAVLARDIAGNRSLVEAGIDGHLFTGAAQLAELLDAAVRAPETFDGIRSGALGKAAARPTLDHEVGAYVALYRRLLGHC